jgi:hypothetical protein
MEGWELLAREQVRQTYAAYNHAGDRFRIADFAGLFTHDGVLEIKGSEPVAGREEIEQMLTGARDPQPADEIPLIRHFVANLWFTFVDPARIESTAYFQVLTQHGLDHWGRYRDVLVPVGDRWLFQHRLVAVDAAIPGGWYASRR